MAFGKRGVGILEQLQEVAVEGNEELAGVKQRVDNKEDPISPDDPGTIVWSKDIYKIPESGGSIKLTAMRIGGSKGAVSVQYATKNQQAVAGKD